MSCQGSGSSNITSQTMLMGNKRNKQPCKNSDCQGIAEDKVKSANQIQSQASNCTSRRSIVIDCLHKKVWNVCSSHSLCYFLIFIHKSSQLFTHFKFLQIITVDKISHLNMHFMHIGRVYIPLTTVVTQITILYRTLYLNLWHVNIFIIINPLSFEDQSPSHTDLGIPYRFSLTAVGGAS